MNKQKIASYLTSAAYLLAGVGSVLGFLMMTVGLWIFLLAVVFAILAGVFYDASPKFFIHYKKTGWVHLNRQAIDMLTDKDVANLSKAERDFFRLYKDCPTAKAEATLAKGKTMTQEALCKRFFEAMLPPIGTPINMAELLATKPGPND
jgi:uncharacterized membrane protein